MKKYITIIILIIAFNVSAQEQITTELYKIEKSKTVQLGLSWSTAVPMGDLASYVRTTSGRGLQLELNQYVNKRWTYGGTFGWQSFFEKREIWYLEETSIISGIQRNYINSLALLGNTKYFFSTSVNGLKAYLDLGIGVSVIENYEIFGLYENRELSWHFTFIPGLGIDIPATTKLGFNIYLKYPNSFKNNSSIHYSWLNTGAGIYLKITD